MRRALPCLIFLSCFLYAGAGQAQAPPQRPTVDRAMLEADRRITAEIRQNSQVMENLEYLSDMIGPRLTGSDKLKRANEWTASRFRDYGLSNAHLEPFTIARGWTRGSAAARVVSPNELQLNIAAAGWSPGTGGLVRGPVIYVNAGSEEAFAAYRGKLKGAIVLTAEPADVPHPSAPKLDGGIPTPLPPDRPRAEADAMGRFGFRTRLSRLLKDEGAACVLRDSRKEHGLIDMTTAGSPEPYTPSLLPTAFISHEGYTLLWRLLKRGPVTVELEMKNQFTDGPVTVYNTVAEIPGSEKPDEMVILGGHIDSWDLGTGTTDNGTGCMAVLEAARAIQALGLKPKRTIRFVFFTAEEQGLNGSKEYARAHEAEMGKVSAVLVHDYGTGRVTHLPLQGHFQCGPVLERLLSPLSAIGFEGVRGGRQGGTDHLSFERFNVPAFACGQDRAEYRKTHHTISDTFDKAWKDDLLQGAMVLAVFAYNVASAPEMLPRPAPQRPQP